MALVFAAPAFIGVCWRVSLLHKCKNVCWREEVSGNAENVF
jgi:hypothetical protein